MFLCCKVEKSPSSWPLQCMAENILELPVTSQSNRYVLAVEDYFTKSVHFHALPNQIAMTVARYLFEDCVLVHRVPEVLQTN